MLFDLNNDPNEFNDLGRRPEYSSQVNLMYRKLYSWALRMGQRTTVSDDWIKSGRDPEDAGILVGIVSPDEVRAQTVMIYEGKPVANYVDVANRQEKKISEDKND